MVSIGGVYKKTSKIIPISEQDLFRTYYRPIEIKERIKIESDRRYQDLPVLFEIADIFPDWNNHPELIEYLFNSKILIEHWKVPSKRQDLTDYASKNPYKYFKSQL